MLTARAQRALSFRARFLRRKLSRATVLLWDERGPVPLGEDGRGWILEPLEQALMLLSFAMPLLAIAALLA